MFILLKITIDLILSVRRCDGLLPRRCANDHTRQASKEFPSLLKFEGDWVTRDYLRIFLKNSAQKAKKCQQQQDRVLEAVAKGKGKGVWAWSLWRIQPYLCLSSQMTLWGRFNMRVPSTPSTAFDAASRGESHRCFSTLRSFLAFDVNENDLTSLFCDDEGSISYITCSHGLADRGDSVHGLH